MINYNELFEKSKELAKKSGLTQLELYQRFMFERILERISVSKYNEKFILRRYILIHITSKLSFVEEDIM